MIPLAYPSLPERPESSKHTLSDHESLMERLADAAQTLESVTIRIYHETAEYWNKFVDDYVRAVLSSKALREWEVFVPLPLQALGPNAIGTTAYRIGQILSARSPERLRRLCLSGVVVQEASMGQMLVGCRAALLEDVYLQDGLWANIVDTVMATRSSDQRVDAPKIELHGVKGGEMGHILLYQPVTREREEEHVSMGYGGTEPIVLMMAEQYLSGEGGVQGNPFREHKDNASYFRGRKSMTVENSYS